MNHVALDQKILSQTQTSLGSIQIELIAFYTAKYAQLSAQSRDKFNKLPHEWNINDHTCFLFSLATTIWNSTVLKFYEIIIILGNCQQQNHISMGEKIVFRAFF